MIADCVTLAAWLHDLDPYMFRLPGGWGPRWYGFAYLLGFVAGYLLVRRVAQVGAGGLRPDRVIDWATYAGVGLLVGGRLGYCLFYKPELFIEFTPSLPFWGVLAVHQGGMASHGGIIGAIAGCVIFAWRSGIHPLYAVDLVAFAGGPGVFFGRIANFINGELYGRPTEASFPLAVRFPQEAGDFEHHPEVSDAVVTAIYQARIAVPPEVEESLVLFHQWVLERVQAGDSLVKVAIAPHLTPRHPSQLYAALSEGLIVLLAMLAVWWVPRRPGVVAGAFLVVYGLMRIANEFFRMPDAYLEPQWLDLSRGQWLSVPMVLIGAAVLAWCATRKTAKVGGWRRGPWSPEATPAKPAESKPA
ncbi:MAG: prolipoprotein diacylglyceryl transferase [Planctomycetota bacterium]